MEQKTETPFRAKICIGHCEVLSTWAASCPKCLQRFRLLWPFGVLHIPLHRYNKRGTAEQWIKEGKRAVKMTRLSCHRFRCNQVRLALSLLAYNLGNLWRRLALPRRIDNWSLTSLQQRLVKTGGRLVKHARYYWLLLAEGHLDRRRFGAMLGRIARLPSLSG